MDMAFTSLASVFAVIALGHALRRFNIIEAGAWAGFERITFLVFFPAIIIQTLAMAELGGTPFLAVSAALVGAILGVAGLMMLVRPMLARYGFDGPAYTSVFQGATRWNTFVAIAIAGSLHGKPALALMAVAVAAMVPLLNIINVAVLARHGAGGRNGGSFLRAILTNPFVWACAIGLVLHPVAAFIPKFLTMTVDMLGRAALAAGLLVVGAGLDLDRLKNPRAATLFAAALKLLLLPLIAWLIGGGMGLSGVALATMMIAASVPTAPGAYVLARQMGGDSELMAEIISFQTLAAMLTLPLILFLTG